MGQWGGSRVDMLLDIPGKELPVATYASLQVAPVGGVTDGPHALGDRLALRGEALGLLASSFPVLRALLQGRDRL